MPIYISRGRFTSDAVKGMLAKPENREEAVAKLFKNVGGKLIGWYLTFGHHDWLAIGEFPNEKAAASEILAAAAGGSLSDIETTVAMTAKRSSRHLRIGRKGGEGLPERRALIGFGRNLNKYQRPRQLKRSHLVGGLRIFADDLTESKQAGCQRAAVSAAHIGAAVNRAAAKAGGSPKSAMRRREFIAFGKWRVRNLLANGAHHA